MSRTLLVLIAVSFGLSLTAHAGSHGMCGKMENFKTTVMADDALNDDQQKQLMAHLDEADAMCNEGKEEEAMAMMKKIEDEFSRDYFDQMMESGN